MDWVNIFVLFAWAFLFFSLFKIMQNLFRD